MISIISSIIIAISVLVMTLITFNPNARSIAESDFMRSARNNAYLYGWELAQLNVRTGNLDLGASKNNIPLGYLSKKDALEQQKLKANISYVDAPDPKEDYLAIEVDKE
ncbi:MAG: hypothetical protein V1830_02620 [Candidatus Omnitrophota bacterium]